VDGRQDQLHGFSCFRRSDGIDFSLCGGNFVECIDVLFAEREDALEFDRLMEAFVIIRDLDIVGITILETETDSPLIVDENGKGMEAMLGGAFRSSRQVAKSTYPRWLGDIDLQALSQCLGDTVQRGEFNVFRMVFDSGNRCLFGFEAQGQFILGQSRRFPCFTEDNADLELSVAFLETLREFLIRLFPLCYIFFQVTHLLLPFRFK
jgi:hypothetical protein